MYFKRTTLVTLLSLQLLSQGALSYQWPGQVVDRIADATAGSDVQIPESVANDADAMALAQCFLKVKDDAPQLVQFVFGEEAGELTHTAVANAVHEVKLYYDTLMLDATEEEIATYQAAKVEIDDAFATFTRDHEPNYMDIANQMMNAGGATGNTEGEEGGEGFAPEEPQEVMLEDPIHSPLPPVESYYEASDVSFSDEEVEGIMGVFEKIEDDVTKEQVQGLMTTQEYMPAMDISLTYFNERITYSETTADHDKFVEYKNQLMVYFDKLLGEENSEGSDVETALEEPMDSENAPAMSPVDTPYKEPTDYFETSEEVSPQDNLAGIKGSPGYSGSEDEAEGRPGDEEEPYFESESVANELNFESVLNSIPDEAVREVVKTNIQDGNIDKAEDVFGLYLDEFVSSLPDEKRKRAEQTQSQLREYASSHFQKLREDAKIEAKESELMQETPVNNVKEEIANMLKDIDSKQKMVEELLGKLKDEHTLEEIGDKH